jgi:hypothetical protein
MRTHCWFNRGAMYLAPLLLLFIMLIQFFTSSPSVCAEGGVGVSGNFSSQTFELAQGASVNVSSVYVDVHNFRSDTIAVRMTTDYPVGVIVNLSQTEFTLAPGGDQRIMVSITATADAAPGQYQIDITAEPYVENTGGIQVVGAAGLSATLKVVGDGGTVTVNLVSADSTPIVGEIRLFKIISGKDYEIARSLIGSLHTAVAPGSFYVVAYAGESEIARENFDVAANENKVINLVGQTIYFAGFDPVPAYSNDSGLLHHIKMVYTLQDLYQPVSNVEVFLLVSWDGGQVEKLSVFSISKLDIGSLGTSYNYVPPDGWVNGNYSFQLQLYINNSFFTGSLAKSFAVSGEGGNSNMGIIIGIVAVVVVVGAVLVYFILKRMKK